MRTLLFLLTFVIHASPALANPCAGFLAGDHTLTDAQVASVRDALPDGYSGHVLTKHIYGTLRTVVVVGESHSKTAAQTTVGHGLVNAFDHIAHEGSIRYENFWFPEATRFAMEGVPDGVHASQLMGPDATHESTINTAWTRESLRDFEDDVIALNFDLIAAGEADLDSRVEDIRTRDYAATVRKDPLTERLARQFDREAMVKRLQIYVETGAPAPGGLRTYDLEADTRPSRRRQLATAGFLAADRIAFLAGPTAKGILLGGAAVGLSAIALTKSASAGAFTAVITAGLAAHVGLILTLDPLAREFIGARERDPLMAREVTKLLSDFPWITQLLVVVGAVHAGGVARALKTNEFLELASWPLLVNGKVVDTRGGY